MLCLIVSVLIRIIIKCIDIINIDIVIIVILLSEKWMLCNLWQSKLQKHQAFEAEVVANKDRIFTTIGVGQTVYSYCALYI